MTDFEELLAQAEGLVDRAHIAAAEAALAAAVAAAQAAQQRAVEADAAVRQARAALPEMIAQAAAGEDIGLDAIVAAHRAVSDGETIATFRSAVARRVDGMAADARDALADATDAAWQPVLRLIQDRMIAAGRRLDRAILLGQWSADSFPDEVARRQEAQRVASAEARADFAEATVLLDHAVRCGMRIPWPGHRGPPNWPLNEGNARRYWNRPLEEDMSHAA